MSTQPDPLDTVAEFAEAAIAHVRDNLGASDAVFSRGDAVLTSADLLAVVERCRIAEARLAAARREAQGWITVALGQPGDLAYTQAGSTASAILLKLNESPGVLRSSNDLPEDPPLFTTRQLFKALEARVERLERTVSSTARRRDPYAHLSDAARAFAGLPHRCGEWEIATGSLDDVLAGAERLRDELDQAIEALRAEIPQPEGPRWHYKITPVTDPARVEPSAPWPPEGTVGVQTYVGNPPRLIGETDADG